MSGTTTTDPAASSVPADNDPCGAETDDSYFGLRIGALFIILVTSACGTLFPIIARRLKVPGAIFDFAKYFGSGVIIATAFIHLLAPAYEELGSSCVSEFWRETYQPWPSAFAMISLMGLFFVELFAHRYGMAYLEKKFGADRARELGSSGHDAGVGQEDSHHHIHAHGQDEHRPAAVPSSDSDNVFEDPEKGAARTMTLSTEDSDSAIESPAAHIMGVLILEFGVIFHSALIGLTLAVTGSDEFITLFIVLIFHQTFEGLGLGARLAYLPVGHLWFVPYIMAIAYSLVTPLGIAIGLGVRETYNPNSETANIVSGIFDSISAGILLWTGIAELLAHEFIFNPKMRKASLGKVMYAGSCVVLGAGLMALLGRWA